MQWHECYNPGNGCEPQVGFAYTPARHSMKARYREFRYNGGVQMGLMDVAIFPIAEALKADFVWALEFDVDFTGSWARFFEQFTEQKADLLSTTLLPLEQSERWWHWLHARPPGDVPRSVWHRAFHPVMRLSRPFLLWYIEEMNRRRWHGHYEYTVPTSALWGGFQVEDLGGTGPLCPADRLGKNYVKTPHQSDEGEGTMVWRPSRGAYWVDAPETFELADTLYHPVKTEAAEWDKARPPSLGTRMKRRWERWRYRT